MSRIVSFDPLDQSHISGFARLMVERGEACGRPISPEYAGIVSNAIGPYFNVSLLFGRFDNDTDLARGVAATTDTYSAEGKLLGLEDFVVGEDVRCHGYGRELFRQIIIDAWEAGMAGLTWEATRNNEAMRQLYIKFDPALRADHLKDVWCCTEKQTLEHARSGKTTATLATLDDLTAMARTLEQQLDSDIGCLVPLLAKEKPVGIRGAPFAAIAQDKSFIIASATYSPLQGAHKIDVRIYLSRSTDQASAADLIKAAAVEIAKRKWRGAMHVKFSNDTYKLHYEALRADKRKTEMVQRILEEKIGCMRLVERNAPVATYNLVGERYVSAVIDAVKNSPNRPLSASASKQLSKAAHKCGLDYTA